MGRDFDCVRARGVIESTATWLNPVSRLRCLLRRNAGHTRRAQDGGRPSRAGGEGLTEVVTGSWPPPAGADLIWEEGEREFATAKAVTASFPARMTPCGGACTLARAIICDDSSGSPPRGILPFPSRLPFTTLACLALVFSSVYSLFILTRVSPSFASSPAPSRPPWTTPPPSVRPWTAATQAAPQRAPSTLPRRPQAPAQRPVLARCVRC